MRPDVASVINQLYASLQTLWQEASSQVDTDADGLFHLWKWIESLHGEIGACIRDLHHDPYGAAEDALECLRSVEGRVEAELRRIRAVSVTPGHN